MFSMDPKSALDPLMHLLPLLDFDTLHMVCDLLKEWYAERLRAINHVIVGRVTAMYPMHHQRAIKHETIFRMLFYACNVIDQYVLQLYQSIYD